MRRVIAYKTHDNNNLFSVTISRNLQYIHLTTMFFVLKTRPINQSTNTVTINMLLLNLKTKQFKTVSI